jgi:hypothetical protein
MGNSANLRMRAFTALPHTEISVGVAHFLVLEESNMSVERPHWMEGGTKRPTSQKVPFTPPQYTEKQATIVQPGTHRNVVIGVTRLAVLTLFSAFFWAGIGLSAAFIPVDVEDRLLGPTLADYLTPGRIIMGVATGVIGTIVAWVIADSFID